MIIVYRSGPSRKKDWAYCVKQSQGLNPPPPRDISGDAYDHLEKNILICLETLEIYNLFDIPTKPTFNINILIRVLIISYLLLLVLKFETCGGTLDFISLDFMLKTSMDKII